MSETAIRPPLKGSDHWCTPKWILDLVRQVDEIAIDPCPGPRGWTGAGTEFRLDEGQDGLTADWYGRWLVHHQGKGLVYCNPPYGRGHLDLWAKKILEEAEHPGPAWSEIIALLPATPSPKWFQLLAPAADGIVFLKIRPKFVDPATGEVADSSGTKDSAVFYFGDRVRKFRRAFEPHGWFTSTTGRRCCAHP